MTGLEGRIEIGRKLERSVRQLDADHLQAEALAHLGLTNRLAEGIKRDHQPLNAVGFERRDGHDQLMNLPFILNRPKPEVLAHDQLLGLADSPAYVGEPPCNGCAERFIRTLKEQCIWSRTWRTVEELAAGVRAFVESYNDDWLIERHGHCTPREAYARALTAGAA